MDDRDRPGAATQRHGRGSTETYVRELTDPKYQGRSGGSEGNRAAADYIAAEFERLGLQQLPGLGGWKQSYPTSITAVLPGKAWLVDPDGSEAPLELGVDWAFRASPEPVDATLTLSTDDALCDEGKGIWDAKLDLKGASRRLSLTSGDVANGTNYTNATGTPSRILVTEEVYAQLNQPGYQIRLWLPDAVDELGTAENVVAYLPGRDSTKAVLLGANFDGAGQCGPLLMAGAYNNASGVATMLQTTAWLAGPTSCPATSFSRPSTPRTTAKTAPPRWPMSWKAATSSCGCSTSSAWAGRATR